MIRYIPGWTYVNKRGGRATLISVDNDRVKYRQHPSNHRSPISILETSLKNFQRWTDEARTFRLHLKVAQRVVAGCFTFKRNSGYAVQLVANQPLAKAA